MLAGWRATKPDSLVPLMVFGTLGLSWTLLTFHVARHRGGRAAVALAPAAFQALFPIAGPEILCTVAALISITDWTVHQRGRLPGIFNLGQYLVGCWVAVRVANSVHASVSGLPGVALSALAGAMTVSVVSLFLTQFVIRLAAGRSPKESGILAFSLLVNEIELACFSAMLAIFWDVHPLMLAVPVIPLTLLFLVLSRLEQREGDLRHRQKELQAIQDLGLQVSSRLEGQELAPEVTRIVADDLRAKGAVLAFLDEERRHFRVMALFDRRRPEAEPLERLERFGIDDAFLARRQPLVGDRESLHLAPELIPLECSSFLVLPLAILGRADGLLAVYDDGKREPFNTEDAERLVALSRFIEVALNNARLYDDLRLMQEQLVQTEKLSALGQLVSGVAHELNNPLATIIGTAELFDEQSLPDPVVGMVRRIQREGARASRIVRNLLTFSRHHVPEKGWHDLGAIVADIQEIRYYDCKVRNIKLVTDLDPHLPLVQVDRHQIHQVLLNLVTNAEQAISETGRPGTILVRTNQENQKVRVEVVDDGPGIAPENLRKIFNPFFTTKEVGKGTGLGLSICFGIVQQHGGTIRASSTPGQGAVFTLELPIPPAPPERPERTPVSLAGVTTPARGSFAGGRALVVDDEEGVRAVLSEALEIWGFKVETAESGETGLDRLRAERFDLAIIDLRMPGLGGQGLYHGAIKEGLTLPPLVFSSGDAANQTARLFLDQTGAPVLLKPFTLVTLRETVEAALAGTPITPTPI